MQQGELFGQLSCIGEQLFLNGMAIKEGQYF
jgi:hypothetical protein